MSESDPGAFVTVARQLVDDLAEGWTKGRAEQMLSIFAAEPVFVETPFSEPLHGLDAVKQWFADIPFYQSETTFTAGEVFVAGPWFSVEFKLVFRRRTSGMWVDARGAIFAETDGSKVTEMRMYWHRWDGGRDTSVA